MTLRPNSTGTSIVRGSGSPAVVGAATFHAALNDNSDASYVSIPFLSTIVLGMDDLSLPSGATITSIATRVRAAKEAVAGSGQASIDIDYPTATDASAGPVVTWLTPTTIAASTGLPPVAATEINGASFRVSWAGTGGAPHLFLYEAYLDVTYFAKPVTDVAAPSGTITNTNTPAVQWVNTLDPDGGGQRFYEVKIFTAAQYGAGGFSPDTSTPTQTSGETTSSVDLWRPLPLASATYRAYVRVSQDGVTWSDWDYTSFVVSVAAPGAPTVAVTAQNTDGRIRVVVTSAVGGVTTDLIEVQRSADGGTTWEFCRTDRILLPSGGVAKVWDFEAPNGVSMLYRARGSAAYSGGEYAASAWTTSSPVTWTSTDQWLKNPNYPALNVKVTVAAFGETQRAARQTVFQPLGATYPIVVSDTPGPLTGTLTLLVADQAARDALDLLLASGGPLLLQGPASGAHIVPNLYVVTGDQGRAPVIDHSWAPKTRETLAWTRVAKPGGYLTYPAGIS